MASSKRAHDNKAIRELENELFKAVFRPGFLPKTESLAWAVSILQRVLVNAALKQTGGHKKRAGDLLNMRYSTITMTMDKYGVPGYLRKKFKKGKSTPALAACLLCQREFIYQKGCTCPSCAVTEALRNWVLPQIPEARTERV